LRFRSWEADFQHRTEWKIDDRQMGHELINKIIEQTRFQMPSWNGESIGIFLFSSKTGDALLRFTQIAKTLFSNQTGLFVALLSQESIDGILAKIKEQRAQHRLSGSAKIVIRLISAGDEVPTLSLPRKCSQQLIHLISDESFASKGEFFYALDDNLNKGLENLLVYSYLQDITFDNLCPPKGVLIEGIIDSQVCDEWVQGLRGFLSRSLYISETRSVKELEDEVDKQLEDRMKIFRDDLLLPFPSMDEFPIDESGIIELFPQRQSKGMKKLMNCLKRKSQNYQTFDVQDSLRKLYGIAADGKLRIQDYYTGFFDKQKIEEYFVAAWSPSNAWYYQIPLRWLLDNLSTRIAEKLSRARNELERLKDESVKSKPITIEPNLETLCQKLGDEYRLQVLYKIYAEIWYWQKALEEVQQGRFHSTAIAAKKRIEEQITFLRNFKDGDYITKGSNEVDWSKDVVSHFKRFKPPAVFWTVDLLRKYFKNNCKWESLNYSSSGGILYCAVNCADESIRSKISELSVQTIKNVGSFTTRWGFNDDIPPQGIFAVAVMPLSFLPDKTVNGGVKP
jgi:hypothetical protein